MTINFNDLWVSLEIMWKGMAGLFMVCVFIMLLVMIISKVMALKGKKNQNG